MSGLPVSGYPVSGYPVSGYPVSGYPGAGYPGAAYPMSGVPASGLPGYPGYPPPYGFLPPPVPKKRRTGLWIGLGAGLLVLLLVCAGMGSVFFVRRTKIEGARPVATSASPAQPTATPAAAAHFTGQLPSLLIAVPTGAKAVHEYGNPDGTLSSSQAAAAYTDVAKVTADFDSFGYQRGAVVAWDDHGRNVFIELYQFSSDTQAVGWLEYHRGSSDTLLPGVAGSRVRSFAPDADGWGETVIAAYRHDIVLNMWTYTKGTDDVASAEAIAAQQFARLP